MVITCPHALGLAVPLVVAVSTSLSAGHRLLIRDRSAFERALQAIVFDKTGTLTEGRFGVTDVVSLDGSSEDESLRLAAGLESQSEHPIAAGAVRGARERQLSIPTPRDFKSIPGKGAQASLDGRQVKVVSPGYLTEQESRPATHVSRTSPIRERPSSTFSSMTSSRVPSPLPTSSARSPARRSND